MAKIMRKKYFKKMLAGNSLKIHVGASFEINSTLVLFVKLREGSLFIVKKYLSF